MIDALARFLLVEDDFFRLPLRPCDSSFPRKRSVKASANSRSSSFRTILSCRFLPGRTIRWLVRRERRRRKRESSLVESHSVSNRNNPKEALTLLSRAADSFCYGDIIESSIRSRGNWDLLPVQVNDIHPPHTHSRLLNCPFSFN